MTEETTDGAAEIFGQPAEEQWRKATHYFTIEVRVGMAWVRHGHERYADPASALSDARKFMGESSIGAVRISSETIEHRHAHVWEQESDNIIALPQKFTDTGTRRACRKCQTMARVASNGTDEFTFCSCGATLPA